MPELPDVEGFRGYLARHATGQRILAVYVPDREIVRNRSPQALGRSLPGTEFASPTRHGKWLIVPLAYGTAEVLLHFGMTGLISLWRARVDPHTAVSELGPARDRRLYDALHAAVTESIRYGRVPHGRRWLTRVRDERTARCPRCQR